MRPQTVFYPADRSPHVVLLHAQRLRINSRHDIRTAQLGVVHFPLTGPERVRYWFIVVPFQQFYNYFFGLCFRYRK